MFYQNLTRYDMGLCFYSTLMLRLAATIFFTKTIKTLKKNYQLNSSIYAI